VIAGTDERLAARTDDQHESVWHFGGLSWLQLIRRVWRASNDDDIYNRAYGLAYNFLIAVFPLLLFLMALFGLSVSEGAKLQYDLFRYFQEILPPLASDLLRQTATEVVQRSNGGKLTFGLLLALYAGSAGTTQLMSTLNFAYQVRETRSWIEVRLISMALTLVMSMLVIVASLMVLAGGFVAESLGREIGLSAIIIAGWKVLQWIISVAFVLLACALVYYFGPDLRRPPLALDYGRLGHRRFALAYGFGCPSALSPLHHFLQCELWLGRSGDHFVDLVLRYGACVPDRRRSKFRHRTLFCCSTSPDKSAEIKGCLNRNAATWLYPSTTKPCPQCAIPSPR
jgi:YihY family inner membrane protein